MQKIQHFKFLTELACRKFSSSKGFANGYHKHKPESNDKGELEETWKQGRLQQATSLCKFAKVCVQRFDSVNSNKVVNSPLTEPR